MWRKGAHTKSKSNGPWGAFIQIVQGGGLRDTVGALKKMACDGAGRGEPWPFEVGDFRGVGAVGVWDRLVGYVVHVGYFLHSSQGCMQLPYHRPIGCDMEGCRHHHQLVSGGINRVSRWHARVQGSERYWHVHARGQTPPLDYGHAPGGPVQDLFRSPQGLWRSGLRAYLGDPVDVWGRPSGMLTPDLVFGAGYHGGEVKRILRGPLPGVPGSCPVGPIDGNCRVITLFSPW